MRKMLVSRTRNTLRVFRQKSNGWRHETHVRKGIPGQQARSAGCRFVCDLVYDVRNGANAHSRVPKHRSGHVLAHL